MPNSFQPSESTTTSTTIRTTTSTTNSVVKRIYTTSTSIITTTSTTSVDTRKNKLNCTKGYFDILDNPVPRFSDGEWISGKEN